MSLMVTVQVTKTSTHLEQIGQMTVTNMGVLGERGTTQYRVVYDGVLIGFVEHMPSDGAKVLLAKAFEMASESWVD